MAHDSFEKLAINAEKLNSEMGRKMREVKRKKKKRKERKRKQKLNGEANLSNIHKSEIASYKITMDKRYMHIVHICIYSPNGIEFHRIVNARLLLVELKPLNFYAIRMSVGFLYICGTATF